MSTDEGISAVNTKRSEGFKQMLAVVLLESSIYG